MKVITALFALLESIPLLGYLIAFVVAILLSLIGVGIFKLFAFDFLHIILLGAGGYLLIKLLNEIFKIPKKRVLTEQQIIFLAILALLLLMAGVPNLLFSMLGTGAKYSVVLP